MKLKKIKKFNKELTKRLENEKSFVGKYPEGGDSTTVKYKLQQGGFTINVFTSEETYNRLCFYDSDYQIAEVTGDLTFKQIKKYINKYVPKEEKEVEDEKDYSWKGCFERLEYSFYLTKFGFIGESPETCAHHSNKTNFPKREQADQFKALMQLTVIAEVLNKDFPANEDKEFYYPFLDSVLNVIVFSKTSTKLNPLFVLKSVEALNQFQRIRSNMDLLNQYFGIQKTGE